MTEPKLRHAAGQRGWDGDVTTATDRYTSAQVVKMLRHYADLIDGKSSSDLNRLGVKSSTDSLSAWWESPACDRAEFILALRWLRDQNEDVVYALVRFYSLHWSQHAIARDLGVSTLTVSHYCHEGLRLLSRKMNGNLRDVKR